MSKYHIKISDNQKEWQNLPFRWMKWMSKSQNGALIWPKFGPFLRPKLSLFLRIQAVFYMIETKFEGLSEEDFFGKYAVGIVLRIGYQIKFMFFKSSFQKIQWKVQTYLLLSKFDAHSKL